MKIKKIVARIACSVLALLMVLPMVIEVLGVVVSAEEIILNPSSQEATTESSNDEQIIELDTVGKDSNDLILNSQNLDTSFGMEFINTSTLNLVNFEKKGNVVTIVNDYNENFYLRKEFFAMDGSYYSPAKEQVITKEEFEKYYRSRAFDIADIKIIVKNKSSGTLLNVMQNKFGELLDTSYAGIVVDGSFAPITIDTIDKKYSWILKDEDNYYQCVSDPKTKETIKTQITKNDYEKLIFNKTYTYSRIIETEVTSEGTKLSDMAYDTFSKRIGIPTVIVKDDTINIAELFFMVNEFNQKHESEKNVLYAMDSITQYIKKYSAPLEEGETDVTDGTSGKTDGLIPSEMLSKYSEIYTDWQDDYNKGYFGSWLDPSFSGHMAVQEWEDPFWTQDEIKHRPEAGGVSYGYYDDLGNYIKVDSDGKVVPKEAGTFDNAGNFSPKDTTGYYDPDGIYHPIFEKLKGLKYDFDGNFHIDDDGYFDNDGTWHSKTKSYSELILHDGRILYPNGVLINTKTNMQMETVADMWGKFFIADEEIVFQDASVYHIKNRTLTYSDGTQYQAKVEDLFYSFDDNTIIMKDTFEKGKKESINITFPNGAKILTSGTIQYPNSITYSDGVATLPNTQKVTGSFSTGHIDVSSFGYIYPNGHVATINEYGDLITDTDAVILSNEYVMLANGNLYKDGKIILSYVDMNGNVVATNGIVINRELQIGSYNELGEFVPNVFPVDSSYSDRTGAKTNPNGAVIYKDKIGGYDEHGVFIEDYLIDKDGYYTVDGHFVGIDGIVTIADKSLGYYDKGKNFVMNDGRGYFDSNGTLVTGRGIYSYVTGKNGLVSPVGKSQFILTMDGNIELQGQSGHYNELGMVTIDRDFGYYDENGRFVISKVNPYSGYFYDSKQTKHAIGTIYKDSEGILRLLKNPTIGLEIVDNKITTSSGTAQYNANGLTEVNGKKGFYTNNKSFVVSDISPYSGGFFDEAGMWIDKTYYTDPFGSICNNNGGFNYLGNYVTPVGDMGSFDMDGKFHLGISNKNDGYFYNDVGGKTNFDNFYIDEFGMYKNTNGNEVYDQFGNSIISQKVVGLKLGDYVMVGYGIFLDVNGNLGYFGEDGVFKYGRPTYKNGFFTPDNGFISFGDGQTSGKTGNIYYINNKYFVVNNNDGTMTLNTCDGYSFAVTRVANKYFMFSNGILLADTGDVGYFDASGMFVKGAPESFSLISMPPEEATQNGNEQQIFDPEANTETTETTDTPVNNTSSSSTPESETVSIDTRAEGVVDVSAGVIAGESFKTNDGKYIVVSDKNGYYLTNGTYMMFNGTYGYFDVEGNFYQDSINPYRNGFYKKDKVWVPLFMSATPPNKGYYNKFGMPRNGENPLKSGFYDYEGTWHPSTNEYFIDYNGNVIKSGNNAIGYFDSKNRYHPYNNESSNYFSEDGTYYNGSLMLGYFNSEGALIRGKNPSFEGFYDEDKNWHIFGDKGYYTEKGIYIESVTDEVTGYFNEVGEFTLGYNPYINGYNDFNGNWNNKESNPLRMYFEKDGTPRIGENPYGDGYFDMYANWHPYFSKGYFDKHGTYFSVTSDSIGYYDSKGNYREGTNPYQHGYFDENKNLRLFEHSGYFTSNGTHIDSNGEKWYFTKDKLKKKGENVYKDGFYDSFGTWYPWNENGCYTSEGIYFPTLLVVDKYKVDSANYILFEGVFKNPEFVPDTIKNTIQFTLGRNKKAPLFVDTGIKVSQNAMISYGNAKDLLHNISIYSRSTFIEDNNACIVVIDGRIINLQNNGKMSIKELRDKFIDADVEITIAKSRMGERYALADSIEIGKKITLTYKDKLNNIKNPLMVREGIPYISLKDISEFIAYDIKSTMTNNSRVVTFALKGDVSSKLLPLEIMCILDNAESLITHQNNTYSYYNLRAPLIEATINELGTKEIYVPIYMLSDLSGMNVEYNTKTSSLVITSEYTNLPFSDN